MLMPRRAAFIAIAAALVLVAILGAVSPAQDPVATQTSPAGISSPAATSTPDTPAGGSTPADPPAAESEPVDPAPGDPEPVPTAPSEPDPTQTASPDPVSTPPSDASPEPPSAVDGPADLPAAQAQPASPPLKGVTRAPASSDEPRTQKRRTRRDGGKPANQESREGKVRSGERSSARAPVSPPVLRRRDGAPAPTNPSYSLATPGPARIGVPNFLIDRFRIPPFLLPIYQAAGTQYSVRWEVLAAINEIETDYGRNLNVSSAGALGWMQFMPATWRAYGVDANRDGEKDPYNPVDAIFAAARYLRAAGADTDLRKAIFAYNHADWYVESVLLRARVVAGLPADLVGSLSGLTQGRFPVFAKATYASELTAAERRRRVRAGANAALLVEADGRRRGIRIYARRGAPVIAVGDGRIVSLGRSRRLGRFVKLRDTYGNSYTYAQLGRISRSYAVPRKDSVRARGRSTSGSSRVVVSPRMPIADRPNALVAGRRPLIGASAESFGRPVEPETAQAPIGFDRRDFRSRRLRVGARVIGGTILGRIGARSRRTAGHLLFEIRPAGRGAPRIDPKPILDGWKLLESTAVYRAAGRNPLLKPATGIGEILLMSKEQLTRRVLSNPGITVGGCQRDDVRTGQVDRRVLAALEFLAASGMRPTVTSLRCGRDYLTASGNVSEHTSGNAVDIAAINGIPILGNQGRGSITEMAVQRLLKLQGTMKPHQIITLMQFAGADNTLAMSDHADHIHVGWRPLYGQSSKTSKRIDAFLRPRQWIKLIDRLDEIDNPEVREQPSRYSVKTTSRPQPRRRPRRN